MSDKAYRGKLTIDERLAEPMPSLNRIRQDAADARLEIATLRNQLTDALGQRDEAHRERARMIADARMAIDAGEKIIATLTAERDEAMRERDAWIETAQIESENKEFYRGLVIKIGEPFGPPAYTSDDGSVQQDVLALKVPELVSALKSERDNAVAQVAVCKGALERALEFAKRVDMLNPTVWAKKERDALRQALSSIGPQAERLLKVVEVVEETRQRLATFEAQETKAEKKRRRRRSVMREGLNKIFALTDARLTASTNPEPEKGTT